MSRKWEEVKKLLEDAPNKPASVKQLLEGYGPGKVQSYLAKELLKHLLSQVKEGRALPDTVALVSKVVEVMEGAEGGVMEYLARLAPHFMVSISDEVELVAMGAALHPAVAAGGAVPSRTNNNIINALLRVVAKLKQDPLKSELLVEAYMLSLRYLPLSMDCAAFSSVPVALNTARVFRDMGPEQRTSHRTLLWGTVEWCLETGATDRLPDLIFPLLTSDAETGRLERKRVVKVLESYTETLSNHALRKLFHLTIEMIGHLVCGQQGFLAERLEGITIAEAVFEVFDNDNKDFLSVILPLCRFLAELLLHNPTPLHYFPFIDQVCRLLLRVPEPETRSTCGALLAHVRAQIGADPGRIDGIFDTYTPLLLLSLSHFTKCRPGREAVGEFVAHVLALSPHVGDVKQRMQLLDLGTKLPEGYPVPVDLLLALTTLLRRQGHISEAISLLSGVEEESSELTLQLILCHVTKLDIQPALPLLNEYTLGSDDVERGIVFVLRTYCNLVHSIGQNNTEFTLPEPVVFIKAVRALLDAPPLDDCLLSVVQFLGGLYGLGSVVDTAVRHLSPHSDNTATVLSALPWLQTGLQWSDEVATLSAGQPRAADIEELWAGCQEEEEETDKQRQCRTNMLRSVRLHVLTDSRLREGTEVYEQSEGCAKAALDAAFTVLRSWKRANMSTRALHWRNCSVLPYLLHVLARHVHLLFLWGSVQLTLSFLDRLLQLARFTRSEYWLTRHRHLSTLVRLTLQRVAAPLPPLLGSSTTTSTKDRYLRELHQQERALLAEHQILSAALEGSQTYPVFSASLPPLHIAHLLTLQLTLLWGSAPEPETDTLAEYISLLTARRDEELRTPPETDRLARAWAALLASCQQSTAPAAPAPRRKTRQTRSRKQEVVEEEREDAVEVGLRACEGLRPVFVRCELLRRRGLSDWWKVEELHNAPYDHTLRELLRAGDYVTGEGSSDVTRPEEIPFPETWTVASVTLDKGSVLIGQRTSRHAVLFRRELPFTLRSQGVGDCNTSCVDDMRQLLAQNDDSVTLVKDKAEFWSRRYSLDGSLERLLEKAEQRVLGPWKGLLMGALDDNTRAQVEKAAVKLRRELKRKYKVEVSVFLSQYLVEHASILSEEELEELVPGLSPAMIAAHSLDPAEGEEGGRSRQPVLLCLDESSDIIPWEACRVYRGQPISRVPSTTFALTLLKLRSAPVKLRREDAFYILNPEQNLPGTEEFFAGWLAEREGWRGVASKPPTLPEYSAALKSDLFVYLGHGSGKEFLAGTSVQELGGRAVALLMGCNTGRLKHTQMGYTGTPIDYLLSGCPAVLGYLWNITDRDCDRYTKRLLDLWLERGSEESLTALMNPSRGACKLAHLVGAAPVLYGVPDILCENT